MQEIRIRLSEKLFAELHLAAADCGELDEPEVCSLEDFARECIEAVLADRRTERRFRTKLERAGVMCVG